MDIKRDDPSRPEIRALLAEHMSNMLSVSPRESVHALDAEGLKKPGITFWAAWEGEELLGCGALREIDSTHGEVKSMRTVGKHRRKGVARAILEHIMREAAGRGYKRLSLETGSQDAFEPARTLYSSFGFQRCPPIPGYREDANSVFMTRALLST
jgi:putative acetyltransferase